MNQTRLYDILAPQFLTGFTFPAFADQLLSRLAVDHFTTTYDAGNVLYAGRVFLDVSGDGQAIEEIQGPDGAFSWETPHFNFRLTVPRDGDAEIQTAANAIATVGAALPGGIAGAGAGSDLQSLFNAFGPLDPAPAAATPVLATEYPGSRFRLELQADVLTFKLGDMFRPGEINNDNRIVPSTDPSLSSQRVKIILPKAMLVFEQLDFPAYDLDFRVASWGSDAGFESAETTDMGTFVRMEPAIAVHTSGTWGFSLDEVVWDGSTVATPPALEALFGVDETFTGIYIRSFIVYYSDNQGIGFSIIGKDALIDFHGKPSFELALTIFLHEALQGVEFTPRFYHGRTLVPYQHRDVVNNPPLTVAEMGQASVQAGDVLQLMMSGGYPPYTVHVARFPQNAFSGSGTEIWNATARSAPLSDVGDFVLKITVSDHSLPAARTKTEWIALHVVAVTDPATGPASGGPLDNPQNTAIPAATLTEVTADAADTHRVTQETAAGTTLETLRLIGGDGPRVTVRNQATSAIVSSPSGTAYNNLTLSGSAPAISFELPAGGTYTVDVHYGGGAAPASLTKECLFKFDCPRDAQHADANNPDTSQYTAAVASGTVPSLRTKDSIFCDSYDALETYLATAPHIAGVALTGRASDDNSNDTYDVDLSARRVQAVTAIFSKHSIPVGVPSAVGHAGVAAQFQPHDRRVDIAITFAAGAATDISYTISRPAMPAPGGGGGGGSTITPPNIGTPPNPPAQPNVMPDFLTKLGFRMKMERGDLSLLEIFGEIDFETALEAQTRSAPITGDASIDSGTPLGLQQRPSASANPNPKDGRVDFTLGYTYDHAIQKLDAYVIIGADPEDKDGLLEGKYDGSSALINILGALLVFAPIINSAAGAAGSDPGSAGNWVALGVAIGLPIAIGGSGIFRTKKITFYGGEARLKFIELNGSQHFSDFVLMLDYGVSFDVVIEALGINTEADGASSKPMSVRYKALGFAINRDDDGAFRYVPVFDASRGYALDLSDPSLFKIKGPLGQLFSIAAARIARVNPVTLELDLAIKVDLGVITVDQFKVKVAFPDDSSGSVSVSILPSGVKVNIPGVLVGKGFFEIINETDEDGIEQKGVAGALDLTLVTLKLRVDANASVVALKDPATNREAIATYLGLQVQFPTPFPLWTTGLGLYGLSGLFAMHFMRLEDPANPASAVGPALAWLIKAQGEPTHLKNTSGEKLWGAKLDHWAFGVGVMIGTMEGGIIANFHGMFILELPGPRILITVNIKIIQPPPGLSDTSSIAVGILGVIDLDFNRNTLTVNVLIAYEIKDILSIKLPIEIFFNLVDSSDWHLYVGTNDQPASADILGIVKGTAYLMISGNQLHIHQLDPHGIFPGVALAVGISASLTLGDESIDIYLRIAARADVGLSFSPFLIVGKLTIEGELKLVVISIGADAIFDLQSNGDVTHAWGKVCGHVHVLFFKISACVKMSIGGDTPVPPGPPPTLVGGVYLQSFSPALIMGQGAGKPIDASLGNAFEDGITAAGTAEPVVPIDSIPVIQFRNTPKVAPGLHVIGNILGQAPSLRGAEGFVDVSGGGAIRYALNSISLSYDGQGGADTIFVGELPPAATWRPDPTGNALTGAANNVDLALFSTCPSPTERALERSEDLLTTVEKQWAGLCTPPAPPPCVLYTFCGQPDGPSQDGWTVKGIAQPDKPGTKRTEPVKTTMKIDVAKQLVDDSTAEMLQQHGIAARKPARIISMPYAVLPNENTAASITSVAANKTPDQLRRTNVDERKDGPVELVKSERELFKNTFEHKGVIGYRGCWMFNSKERGKTLPNPSKNTYRLRNNKGLSMPLDATLLWWDGGDTLPAHMEQVGSGVHSGLHLYGLYLMEFVAPVVVVHLKTICSANDPIIAIAYDSNNAILDIAFQLHHDSDDKNHAEDGLHFATRDFVLYGDGIRRVLLFANSRGVLESICVDKHADSPCLRGLQLPYFTRDNAKISQQFLKGKDSLAERLKKDAKGNFILLQTGAAKEVTILAACRKEYEGKMLIEEGRANGAYDPEYGLGAGGAAFSILHHTSDLPALWKDASSPWKGAANTAFTFIAALSAQGMDILLITLKPKSTTVRIRLHGVDNHSGMPGFVIGAVAVCPRQSKEEIAVIKSKQETQIKTLTGYLSSATAPLLKPNKRYNLTVTYDSWFRDKDGHETQTAGVLPQTFHFRTDNAAPKTLDGHVLGTWPNAAEPHHFYEDPVQVYFNDKSVFAIYDAYGKSLQMIMRGADGKPVTGGDDDDANPSSSAVNDSQMTDLDGFVKTPYLDMLEQVASANNLEGCAGKLSSTQHTVLHPPFILKPNMGYLLDIELAGETPTDDPHRPLFRLGFNTSRYATMAAFAADLKGLRIYHAALSAAPAFTTSGPVTALPDLTIENALTAAGFHLAADPKETKMVILWAPSGGGHFRPWGLMVDALEPMWRQREIAVLEPVADASGAIPDPLFKVWKHGFEDSLVVAEHVSGSAIVSGYIRSTGGTRTIALINPAALAGGDRTLTLDLKTTANTNYNVAQSAASFTNITLTSKAPWEE